MDYNDVNYYKYNKYLLSLVGQWPYQKTWSTLLMRSVVVLSSISGVFVLSAKLFTSKFETNTIMSVSPLLACASLGVMNLLFFYVYSRKFNGFWDRMHKSWETDLTQGELNILRDFSKEGRLYTLIYIIYGYGAVFGLIPLSHKEQLLNVFFPLNESRPYDFPFYTDHLIDRDRYEIYIYLHIHGIILIGLTAVLANVCSFLVFLLHISGRFTMLGYRLRNIFDTENQNKLKRMSADNKLECNTNAYENVVDCIRKHRDIIEFVDSVRSFYEPIIFIQLIGSAFIISTTIIHVLEFEHLRIRYTAFCIAQFFYLITASYVSQKVINSSENLSIEV